MRMTFHYRTSVTPVQFCRGIRFFCPACRRQASLRTLVRDGCRISALEESASTFASGYTTSTSFNALRKSARNLRSLSVSVPNCICRASQGISVRFWIVKKR